MRRVKVGAGAVFRQAMFEPSTRRALRIPRGGWCAGHRTRDDGKTARIDINTTACGSTSPPTTSTAPANDRRHAARRTVPLTHGSGGSTPAPDAQDQLSSHEIATALEGCGPVFSHIANTFIGAFVDRAGSLLKS
jgi:hypothetical protein